MSTTKMTRGEKMKFKKQLVSVLNPEKETSDSKMITESINNYAQFGIDYNDKVCLDLGANIGGFTLIALNAGAKKVIIVEMDERNLVKLHEAFDGDDRVEIIEGAICNSEEDTIQIFKGNSKQSNCSTSIFNKHSFKSYDTVNVVNLKKLMDQYKPEIIKMDIESAEYQVLDDALEYRPETFFVELHGGKHKVEMEKWTEVLKSEYKYSDVSEIHAFKSLIGKDCLFTDNKI